MTLKNLTGLKWVGQLFIQDADILAQYAKNATSILEFGAGGSTMIFAQLNKNVTCVETSPRWADITKQRLAFLGCEKNVEFLELYDYFNNVQLYKADLVLIDGEPKHRGETAEYMWKSLIPGGYMLFHDTQTPVFMTTAQEFITAKFKEIETIEVNKIADDGISSTLTVIKKRRDIPFPVDNRETWVHGRDIENITRLWEYKEE